MWFNWPGLRRRDVMRHCLFCLRSSEEVAPKDGVMGVNGFVCRQCITLCMEAIGQENPEWCDEQIAKMTAWREHEKQSK